MALSWFRRLFPTKARPRRKSAWEGRCLPSLERLRERVLPAVTASFSPASGLLRVFGDSLNNTIAVSRDAAGKLLVNGGAVAIKGGTATVANTSLVKVFGQGGNDRISLNESKGALPAANLFGGAGNDVLVGGSGDDTLFGEAGHDALLGKGGEDILFGGAGNDALTGGTGDDLVFGDAGNDRLIGGPGEGTDLNEGGAGIDTIQVHGGNGAETFTVTASGVRVRFDRTAPAPFSLDIGTSENLVLKANAGDDVVTAGNGLAPLIKLTFDGGAGNDTLTGGDGNDRLLGGDGNDVISGGRGNDKALMGAGHDKFVWNPGDGNDTVEGQAGVDALQFNGADVNEKIALSAYGSRLRLLRDVASVVMDTNAVEQINVAALGGADTLTVNALAGTGVTAVNIDLKAQGSGDGQADTILVNGTAAGNAVQVLGSGTSFSVAGLPALVQVQGSEGANDTLVVNALGGNDSVTAAGLPAGVVRLTIDGGAGNDTLTGSDGDDRLLGGDGNDTVNGRRGNDVALMGAGNDRFVWNPGDGNDTVEGQAGVDRLQFNGSGASENIDLSANGPRLRLFRDVASVTLDVDGVEQVHVATFGGADTLTVNDLTGTRVTDVTFDLAATPSTSAGDGQPDTVIVSGTAGADAVTVSGGPGSASLLGLSARVHVVGSEANNDQLSFNACGGDDAMNASGLAAGALRLAADGGDGDDILIGSNGNDVLTGGAGDDILIGGPGQDTLNGTPGSDILIQ